MLELQDAGADSGYLLEHLLVESMGAIRGGGIFAWATAAGARTLIADPTFEEFLKQGNFRLFVGLDSITNPSAIDVLANLTARLPRLDVRAFINPRNGLFHPKMAWFEFDSYLSLIVGSGNLTIGGLRSNWEAFTVLRLNGKEGKEALQKIEEWLTARAPDLAPITDPQVRRLAETNSGHERTLRTSMRPTQQPNVMGEAQSVLVAEIPKAKSRWGQANFDLENYTGFFGAAVGTQRRILLYEVMPNGDLGNVESRPSVAVKSSNYRFELAAARGHPYPQTGRPTAVFIRLATGVFLYVLLLPGDSGFAEISQFLTSQWHGRSDRMRRVRCSAQQLEQSWPNSPFLSAQVPAN